MTKPSVVGRVLMALGVEAGNVVLEVGTGSGYQTAALATLAQRVVTLERWRDLAADARGRFGRARLMNVFAHAADGFDGWAEDAPYDRIVVNAAMDDFPEALIRALKPDGVLVAPLGDAQAQRLIRYRNGERADLGPVTFAPLQRGVSEEAAPLSP
jgi:protein-L-isoaspartate(D-aspartate) O-methyltransferase